MHQPRGVAETLVVHPCRTVSNRVATCLIYLNGRDAYTGGVISTFMSFFLPKTHVACFSPPKESNVLIHTHKPVRCMSCGVANTRFAACATKAGVGCMVSCQYYSHGSEVFTRGVPCIPRRDALPQPGRLWLHRHARAWEGRVLVQPPA